MAPKAIQVTVAIRQTFSTIGIVMFTSESMSHSTASSLEESDDSGVKRLTYTYTNVPRIPVRERSIVHDGAAVLRIIGNPQRALEGEYRTNRKSTGELSLRYEGARIAEVL
jgi:SMODS-associating 2TM, beta-strand rich effector domain